MRNLRATVEATIVEGEGERIDITRTNNNNFSIVGEKFQCLSGENADDVAEGNRQETEGERKRCLMSNNNKPISV